MTYQPSLSIRHQDNLALSVPFDLQMSGYLNGQLDLAVR